jgi:undecaprenyl-diphosphatase
MNDQLSWLQAIVLGISQGLTEFLPVSSSAHTLIIAKIANWPDPGAAFTAVTQIGTEAAVIIYFWNDLKLIIRNWFLSLYKKDYRSTPEAKMGWYVIIGSLPIAYFGLTFQKQVETSARSLQVVAVALIVMGILLGLADRLGKQNKDESNLGVKQAIIFGVGQALALIPGVSRSGATITFGLAMGFNREFAARYSFLLAIPAVLASGLYTAQDIANDSFVNWPATILATVIAFFVGYLVISTLMNYLKTRSFMPFVLYRVMLGLLILGLVQTGSLTA